MSRIIRIATRGPCPAHLCSLGKGRPSPRRSCCRNQQPTLPLQVQTDPIQIRPFESLPVPKSLESGPRPSKPRTPIPGLLLARIRSTSPLSLSPQTSFLRPLGSSAPDSYGLQTPQTHHLDPSGPLQIGTPNRNRYRIHSHQVQT